MHVKYDSIVRNQSKLYIVTIFYSKYKIPDGLSIYKCWASIPKEEPDLPFTG